MAELVVGDNHHAMPMVITALSSLLQRAVDDVDIDTSDEAINARPRKPSAFHGPTKPPISIRSYLKRIFKYTDCSPSCFVVAYIYLRRFTSRQCSCSVDSHSVHRLIITSVMVAVKFMDDIYYNNAYFAKVGGIGMTEMNLLEIDFLFGLQFQLNVTPAAFTKYCSILQTEMCLEPPGGLLGFHCFTCDEEDDSC